VTVEPNNQVTVEAKTNVGWLYGLLDLAERLQWREPIPAQWRWSPPLAERGLVVENPEWLMKAPRSQEALRNLLRERLKELAWWRFNTLGHQVQRERSQSEQGFEPLEANGSRLRRQSCGLGESAESCPSNLVATRWSSGN
jgi:hypothetical protein